MGFTKVRALELSDITKELENSSTYSMYKNMGDTSISSDSKIILIKYPSVRDDKTVTKSIKYELKDNILTNNFEENINNYYFKAFINGYPLGSNDIIVTKEDLEKKDTSLYWIFSILGLVIIIMLIKKKKEN